MKKLIKVATAKKMRHFAKKRIEIEKFQKGQLYLNDFKWMDKLVYIMATFQIKWLKYKLDICNKILYL